MRHLWGIPGLRRRRLGSRPLILTARGRTDELGRCTLTKKLDSFSRQDTAGANGVSFDGRVNGKGLPKGTYTLTLVTTMAGISSSKQTLTFTVTT